MQKYLFGNSLHANELDWSKVYFGLLIEFSVLECYGL